MSQLTELIDMMADLHHERDIYTREMGRPDLSEEQIEAIQDELDDIEVHIEMTWSRINDFRRHIRSD